VLSYTEILRKLVSFPTVNNPIEGVIPTSKILNYIGEELLQPQGYQNIYYEKQGYGSLLSYIKRGSPKILFLGHCDVVPEGPAWETNPFEMTIKDDKAYGRGTADMKGAVSTMLSLANVFANEEIGSIIYLINLDEESGGKYGAGKAVEYLEKYDLMPDYLINGDANGLQVVNKRRNSFVADIKLKKTPKNVRGRRESKNLVTEIAGNRTMHAAYFMKDLDIHCMDKVSDFLRKNNYLLQSIDGKFVKNNVLPSDVEIEYIIPDEKSNQEYEYDENLTKFLYSVHTFKDADIPSAPSDYGINLTFNYYRNEEEHHLCQLDLRIMSKSMEDVRIYFENFIKDSKIDAQIETKGSIGPVYTDEDSILVRTGLQIAREMELAPYPIEMGGATDSRWFSAKEIPSIEFGPLGGNVHGSNEYVELSSLEVVREFYLKLVRALAKTS
jgi:succinyl-diaminopimelate desuccinylase